MLFAVLLVPFLGLLWNAIPDKKWKTILVISLVAIASLPSVVNVYKFRCPGMTNKTVVIAFQNVRHIGAGDSENCPGI